jgi:ankyrin repeat protein
VDAFNLLQKSGANLSAKDAEGLGALHYAAFAGSTEIMKILLTIEGIGMKRPE